MVSGKGNILAVVLVVSALLVVVGIFVFKGGKTDADSTRRFVPTQSSQNANKSSASDNLNGGRYIEYSSEVYQSGKDKRRVLYFYANWCPTCRPANADFEANSSKIPEDVVVIRVNYNDSDTDNNEKELARQYNITYQHTFVQIDEDGGEIVKWNGGQLAELLGKIK